MADPEVVGAEAHRRVLVAVLPTRAAYSVASLCTLRTKSVQRRNGRVQAWSTLRTHLILAVARHVLDLPLRDPGIIVVHERLLLRRDQHVQAGEQHVPLSVPDILIRSTRSIFVHLISRRKAPETQELSLKKHLWLTCPAMSNDFDG